jgi:hypothetical protein
VETTAVFMRSDKLENQAVVHIFQVVIEVSANQVKVELVSTSLET